MTDDELRAWAMPRAIDGSDFSADRVAAGILRLLGENSALRKQVEGLAERVHAQSELLSRSVTNVCVDARHYFPGGHWKCECGRYDRSDMGCTESSPMPRITFGVAADGRVFVNNLPMIQGQLLDELKPMKFTPLVEVPE